MGLSNTPSGSSANNHEDDVACNMNTMYPDGGWYAGDDFSFDGETFFHGRIWPHADDAQGMNFLYPSSNTGRDLAVSRSKKGTSPVGSAVDLDSVTPNPACPGDLITTEYTVENRGNETIVSAIAEVYLSTNNTISSSDTYLGGYAETMTAFTEITRTRTYTIPSGMAAGDYYVGVYFDPDDVFTGEQSSIWNNRIYLPVENSSSDQLTILSSTHPSCL